MTNREQIIAAAREAGMSGLEEGGMLENFERFYAIAFEAGRSFEREECILDLHRNADQTLEEIIAAIRARGDSK